MKTHYKKTLLMWNKANLTTGMTGALCAAVTVFICGMNPALWNFLTAAMVGLGSFWMASWPPCTLAAALKEDQTLLVRVPAINLLAPDSRLCLYSC